VDAEIERRLSVLIERGDLSSEEGMRLLDLLHSVGQPEVKDKDKTFTDAEVERVIRDRGLPTRQDVNRILRQVENLQTELERLNRAAKSSKS
jgi:polyhydroxyalkanoate synthesis regulator phasin